MRTLMFSTAFIVLSYTAAASCAGSPRPSGPVAEDEEIQIVLAALDNQVGPDDRGVCLATPLQGAPPDYRVHLTTKRSLPHQPDQEGYRQDAERLVRASEQAMPGPKPLSPADLRTEYPSAHLARGSDCTGLITIVRPLVLHGWAFLALTKARPCGGFSYRISLRRVDDQWTVRNVDQLGVMAGPPGCADRLWDAPSGLQIERIQLTESGSKHEPHAPNAPNAETGHN